MSSGDGLEPELWPVLCSRFCPKNLLLWRKIVFLGRFRLWDPSQIIRREISLISARTKVLGMVWSSSSDPPTRPSIFFLAGAFFFTIFHPAINFFLAGVFFFTIFHPAINFFLAGVLFFTIFCPAINFYLAGALFSWFLIAIRCPFWTFIQPLVFLTFPAPGFF